MGQGGFFPSCLLFSPLFLLVLRSTSKAHTDIRPFLKVAYPSSEKVRRLIPTWRERLEEELLKDEGAGWEAGAAPGDEEQVQSQRGQGEERGRKVDSLGIRRKRQG